MNSGSGENGLHGRHVVVTRPAGQASHLAQTLSELGAVPVLFPVLEIFDLEDPTPLLDIAARLDSFDIAIFISPNAAAKALDVVLSKRPWPARTRAATMGKSSETELARYGLTDVIAPLERFDSEALLDEPELQLVSGKRIVIFRGDGGRPLLGDTLRARGATVEYVACYRRGKPCQPATPLMDLWSEGRLDAVTLTSSEGLRNFHDMLGKLGQAWLRKTPVFVPHQRIAYSARELGLGQVVLTEPGDAGLVKALLNYFSSP